MQHLLEWRWSIKKGIGISHRKYIWDLLVETSMLGCRPMWTQIEARKKTWQW